MEYRFEECASCAAKPRSPALCPSCLHNRRVIGELLNPVFTATSVDGEIHEAPGGITKLDVIGPMTATEVTERTKEFFRNWRFGESQKPTKAHEYDHTLNEAAARNIAKAFK